MKNSNEFIIQLRSRFLDAINNLLMQMMNPDFGSDTETKEQLITRLKIEAEYLEKKGTAFYPILENIFRKNDIALTLKLI